MARPIETEQQTHLETRFQLALDRSRIQADIDEQLAIVTGPLASDVFEQLGPFEHGCPQRYSVLGILSL